MILDSGDKIFVVIKNSPFYFQLGTSTGKVDFNQIAFEATLVYDCDGFKAVDFVKNKPFDFKSNAGENGQILDVEIRIKVLTSQHEDMLFRVKIAGYHPLSR
jgi:hypothetical protein